MSFGCVHGLEAQKPISPTRENCFPRLLGNWMLSSGHGLFPVRSRLLAQVLPPQPCICRERQSRGWIGHPPGQQPWKACSRAVGSGNSPMFLNIQIPWNLPLLTQRGKVGTLCRKMLPPLSISAGSCQTSCMRKLHH